VPASDPSPHLICIEGAGVALTADDFMEVPENSMAVVLKLAMKRKIAVKIFIRLASFKTRIVVLARGELNNKYALEPMRYLVS
jgi:hypothetical protein